MFSCSTLFAQKTKTASGLVKDAATGSALAGVTIKAGNLNIITQTNNDGSFSFNIPENVAALTFSYVGYGNAEIKPSENMVVTLSTANATLNEVVVVGYGQALKKDITGSITKINSKDVQDFPAPSFESAIQGKAPGVVVESGSGKLGQGIKIRIRGTSSISASSQPLYVVDGLPLTTTSLSDDNNDATNPLSDINPNDIESVEVLKDASAAAIYGARAANGVVLITTKKGRNLQKTTLQLDTYTSISNPARKRHFLDAKQYVDLYNLAVKSDAQYDFTNDLSGYASLDDAIKDYTDLYSIYGLSLSDLANGTDYTKGAVNTNWQNLLFNNNAPSNQINLSASGGDAKTRFFVSGFYNTQDAIVINNTYSRYGGRLNLEHSPNKNLTFGMNLSVDRSQLNRITNDNAFSTPGQLVAQPPITPAYDSTGQPNSNTLYPSGLFDAKYNSDKQVTNRTVGNVFGNLNILPSLSFRTEFGADLLNLNESAFQSKLTQDGAPFGRANLIVSTATNFNTNNYFTFTPNLGDHQKLSAVVGMSYQQSDIKKASTYGEQTPSDAIKNLSGTTDITFGNSQDYRYTFLSYFLRGNYSINEKYLLSASIRTDGSSRFGPANRYGWFPAVSAGWIISEENFMKNSNLFSNVKLRASWGLTGNAEIGESQFYSLYSVSNYPDFPGYTPFQLGNPDLKWEQTAQTDIGLDIGILKNRISGTFDYYNKQTSDLLLNINIPSTTGYTSIYKNVGNMENTGFEGSITSVNFDGKFSWTTTVNAAYNKNKVKDIDGQIIEGGFGITQRAVEGLPIGEFYDQKFLGVDPKTGDALYQGDDGKPTSDFNSAARVPLGNSNPTWTGGITNTFSYKGFDLNFFFMGVTGNKIYNAGGVYMSTGFASGGFDNQTTDILNAWQKPGDITNIPRIGLFYGSGYQNSSRFLYDGAYIRLKNASFGYTLPKSASDALHLSSVRVYVAGYNLLTFTKYPSDPEVNTETLGNIGGGQDFYTIPQARTVSFGLTVKF